MYTWSIYDQPIDRQVIEDDPVFFEPQPYYYSEQVYKLINQLYLGCFLMAASLDVWASFKIS